MAEGGHKLFEDGESKEESHIENHNKNIPNGNNVQHVIAQDVERKQGKEDLNKEQNVTVLIHSINEEQHHRKECGPNLKESANSNNHNNSKTIENNSTTTNNVCLNLDPNRSNVSNSNIDSSCFENMTTHQQGQQNVDGNCLFSSSSCLSINSSKVGDNTCILPVDDYYSFSERDCKSDTEILEDKGESVAEDDIVIVTSSSIPAIPQKVRHHRKTLRSRSWCARTRNDSLNTTDIILLRERLLRTQSRPQPSALRSFTYQQKMTLVSLALVDFMSFCSMSIMAPFFPREANEKGMSDSVSGFVFSFYALVMFITSPIFGKILPSVGAKFMLMSGMFVAGFCNLLFGVLEYIVDYETFTTYCFLIRGLEALGASAYSMASHVFVVNTFPNNIGSVLGILETFIGLGMSVGPAIGGLLYSIGGFGLPFYVLGIIMVLSIPINFFLLPVQNDYSIPHNSGSLLEVVKVPAVVITSIVIVIMSNTWAFLDPTLEPHLRQFDLDAHQVGLIFLLFSGLYGISSPLWGWLADRIHNHWCMMVWGLVLSTVGLLLLGPSPLLPFLNSSLWLNLLGLSILGVSVALTLLPTFQGVLTSSIEEGGCSENIATYSIVAGVWSCMYSLGEVMGPTLGGVLLKSYGFPICSTVMASFTFVLAIITFTFFSCRANKSDGSESSSNESKTDGAWQTLNAPHNVEDTIYSATEDINSGEGYSENDSLLGSTGTGRSAKKQRQSYGGTGISSNEFQNFCKNNQQNDNYYQNGNQENNGSYRMKNLSPKTSQDNFNWDENHNHKEMSPEGLKALIQSECYQKYLDESLAKILDMDKSSKRNDNSGEENVGFDSEEDIMPAISEATDLAHDFIVYNQDKVKYYKQLRKMDRESFVEVVGDDVTDVRGTVNITTSGACEV